jgi:hypothetical protein
MEIVKAGIRRATHQRKGRFEVWVSGYEQTMLAMYLFQSDVYK